MDDSTAARLGRAGGYPHIPADAPSAHRTPDPTLADLAARRRDPIHVEAGGPRPPAPPPRLAVAAALIVIGLTLLASAAAIGYLVGLRSAQADETRTRLAYCDLLDALGADASTPAEVYACSTEPTR